MRHEKIEYKSIEDLIPYARNQRIHSDEQVKKIAASIKEFGFKNPVIVDKEGTIIAGHGRCLAAEKLKIKELPVIVADDLNASQVKALRLADNKLQDLSEFDDELVKLELEELKGLDFDINLTGFDDLIDINALDELDDERLDEVPEAPKEPRTKKGDLYIIDGRHRVFCGDSTKEEDVKRLMGGDKADMVFTDPPYGVSYASKNEFLNQRDGGDRIQKEIENDHMSLDETAQLWRDVFSAWTCFLGDYSSYYICSPQIGGLLHLMMEVMKECEMPYRHCLIWVKNNHVLGRCDYNYKHEPILYGWKDRHKFYGNGDQTKSTWEYNKPLKNDLHPTMKPVDLIINAVKNSTESGMLVTDPFLGSGSTLIACEKTNRKCYGIEIDPIYCDVIIQRYKDLKPEAKIELNGEPIDW